MYSQNACNFDDDLPQQNPGTTSTCAEIEIDLEEINSLPDITFHLAFHFRENNNDQNFTCDPNDPILAINPLLFAPTLVSQVLSEMNTRMDNALLINGQNFDAKINFDLVNGGNCNSITFYESGDPIISDPNAINIIFVNDPFNAGTRGWTFFGANNIFIENYLAAYINQSNNTWDLARLINHEFGHTRLLNHSFFCNNPCDGIDLVAIDQCCGTCLPHNGSGSVCWGCSPNDLMMGYGSQLHLTQCELEEIWSYMINNPRSYQQFELCENPTIGEIVYDINGIETWNSDKIFTQDVVIRDGTTIEVLCDVLMGEEKYIIVEPGGKLIVTGGTINRLCENNWNGIKVYGGNSDFDVQLNNATIENTAGAAISMFAPEPWPQITQFGNGILQANNSTFNDVRRIVEFMAWSPSMNSSFIRNCTQNGGKWGITNWNCIGVEVFNNVFNNITRECIVTETGQFIIEDNVFNGGRTDILFANVSPGIGTLILDNEFNSDDTGIRSLGASLGQNRILNNSFLTGQFDIFLDGDNNYLIRNNDFTADFGSVSVDNGDHSNEVFLNLFDGNIGGLVPAGSNSGYNFYQNCFNTNLTDTYIDGDISPFISADNEEPANNCFTHQGDPMGTILDISGNPNPFDYLEPLDTNQDCLDAVLAHNNVNLIESGDAYYPCNDAGSGAIINPNYNYCNPQPTDAETRIAIAWIQNKIASINNDPSLSQWEKNWLSNLYYRCLRRVLWMRFEILILNDDFVKARSLMASYELEYGDDARIAIYSSYIYENSLDSARIYLNSINSSEGPINDFKYIQSVNLNRIKKGSYFSATQNELDSVRLLANKVNVYSGYAKALYYHLTDIIITSNLPGNLDSYVTPRESQIASLSKSFLIYPNPASHTVHLEILGYDNPKLVIHNILGGIVYQNKLEEANVKLNTEQWNSGLYIISLLNQDEVIISKKLLITK